ncbi:hypothetical protein EVAR_103432_1 [Eumeta japonica]|uniref:Uncharacterized protein n=1 Tax=Eumeta variegata TaxID=151549 RepID=A0A4C1ZAT1_EUMVA|nr:hypothetical protein EVAR_103432_1 [Eumeta japonica]
MYEGDFFSIRQFISLPDRKAPKRKSTVGAASSARLSGVTTGGNKTTRDWKFLCNIVNSKKKIEIKVLNSLAFSRGRRIMSLWNFARCYINMFFSNTCFDLETRRAPLSAPHPPAAGNAATGVHRHSAHAAFSALTLFNPV